MAVAASGALAAAPLAAPSAPLGGTVAPVPTSTVRAAAAPLAGAVPVRVRAPAVGMDTGLVPLGLDAAGALEVPAGAAAATLAGWYTGGPTPGERGPAVLTAHVDWDHRPGPFRRLRALAPGDLVLVDRADGTRATFEIQDVRRYAKDAFPTAAVYSDSPVAGLRLVTCGGSFDRAERSYRDNVVAFAALVTA
ncbi:MAG: class F sortase [Pseudonocardia sp.]|nr:class F sortase [Pseudonocardia sp.]